MATSYADLFYISNQFSFQRRVAAALCQVAVGIDGNPAATGFTTFLQPYAKQVLAGQVNLQAAALGILSTPVNLGLTLNANDAASPPTYGITDAQIQTAAAAIFGALAGT